MYSRIINPFLILLSLATAIGVFVHDTRVDKAAAITLLSAAPIGSEAGAKLTQLASGDLHTHVERGSAAALHAYQATSPSISPRTEDKKHLLQRYVARGHHAFDNYNLPVV